jgi:hypothetical protein
MGVYFVQKARKANHDPPNPKEKGEVMSTNVSGDEFLEILRKSKGRYGCGSKTLPLGCGAVLPTPAPVPEGAEEVELSEDEGKHLLTIFFVKFSGPMAWKADEDSDAALRALQDKGLVAPVEDAPVEGCYTTTAEGDTAAQLLLKRLFK